MCRSSSADLAMLTHPHVACCPQVRVRLDERRIGEIMAGIDSASMGDAFVSTAGRLLGHLGDVMTLGFTPAAVAGGRTFCWPMHNSWPMHTKGGCW